MLTVPNLRGGERGNTVAAVRSDPEFLSNLDRYCSGTKLGRVGPHQNFGQFQGFRIHFHDVCGLHFDLNGQPACDDFCERLVSIRRLDLLSIPLRLGVAGGEGKADAILGALRSKYVNVLVIDSMTARKVLALAKSK